ncbi:hypothetical protein [Niveispirillum sp. BGYR6]|uniref:hypothetical protein n=1 Tax=Niveispirillum sp. BGYR6 TaxID=2971249 RepID=UPI0022B97F51|nr:hypothetical protein [Niveispirillum sp. BGYR6]MDG5496987.1 hypothetical protein [Niveispirillum sp. BGYR6]
MLYRFLTALGIQPLPSRRAGWVVTRCPLAPLRHQRGTDNNPSFGFRVGAGGGRCHCLACGYSGTLARLVADLRQAVQHQGLALAADFAAAEALIEAAGGQAGGLSLGDTGPDIEALANGARAAEHLFPEWWLNQFPPAHHQGQLHPYLQARGVDIATAIALDIRFDAGRQRICFPIRDFNGFLRGLHGRSILPDGQPRYLMYRHGGQNCPSIWHGESWLDPDRPVLIVESVFDAARVFPHYPNVVDPLTADLMPEKIRRLSGCAEYLLLFDNDPAGQAARRKLRQAWAGARLRDLYLPAGYKDPGEAPPALLASLLGTLASPSAEFRL